MLTRRRLAKLQVQLQRSIREGSPHQVLELIERILSFDRQSPIPNLLDSRARTHLMLTRLHTHFKQGDLGQAVRTAREALAMAPYDRNVERLYRGTLDGSRSGAATTLFLCVSRGEPAGAAAMADRLRAVPGTECQVLAAAGTGPAGVESPSHRIREALIRVFETRAAGTRVFRVDDDLGIEDLARWTTAVADIAAGARDYVGEPVSRARFDRARHIARGAEPGDGARPYGKRFHAPFAHRRFYYLSARALEAFAVASLRFPGEIEGELYEDKFVGDTLFKEGIALSAVDPRAIGLLPIRA